MSDAGRDEKLTAPNRIGSSAVLGIAINVIIK